MLVVLLGAVSPAPAADRATELFQTASQQFWNGQYNRALENYRKIASSYPDHDLYWDAQFGAAKSYYEMGKMNRAAKLFRRVQRNHPEKAVRGDALFSLVEVAILQDDIIKARNLLRTFLEVYPEHPIRETARRQLTLLEKTPVSASSETGTPDGTVTEESDRPVSPPKLKPSARETKPEGLPRGDGTPDTRPLSPPPIRGGPDTGSRGDTGPRGQFPADTEASRSTNSPDTPTGASGRISPLDGVMGANGSGTDTSVASSDTATTGSRTPDNVKTPAGDTPADRSIIRPDTIASPASTRPDTPATAVPDTTENKTRKTTGNMSDTTEKMKQRFRRLDRSGRRSAAYELGRTLIGNNAAGAEEYYRMARLAHRMDRSPETGLKYLNKAIALSSNSPGKYFLLKAELLLEADRTEDASSLLGSYRSDFYRNTGSTGKARYHFLRGELLRARKKDDQAFFQYMSVLQKAPESRWGKRTKTILQNEY